VGITEFIFFLTGSVFRGVSVAGDGDSWDFGTGAGFYVNATTPGWSKHYRYSLHPPPPLPLFMFLPHGSPAYPLDSQHECSILKIKNVKV